MAVAVCAFVFALCLNLLADAVIISVIILVCAVIVIIAAGKQDTFRAGIARP